MIITDHDDSDDCAGFGKYVDQPPTVTVTVLRFRQVASGIGTRAVTVQLAS